MKCILTQIFLGMGGIYRPMRKSLPFHIYWSIFNIFKHIVPFLNIYSMLHTVYLFF